MVAKRYLKTKKTKKGLKNIKKSKGQKELYGGSASKKVNTMVGGSACSAAKEANANTQMTGGSLASSFVENYANEKSQNQPINEYQTEMDLPSMTNLKGGSCGCGGLPLKGGKSKKNKANKGKKSKTNKSKKTKKNRKGWYKGGSGASKRVMSAISEQKTVSMDYEPSAKIEDVKSMPNLSETTGGGNVEEKKVMKGGSFWNLAGCGPANYPDAGRKYAHHFTKTSSCPGPDEIMNPPNLGKAGSGDSAELTMGGTYPFA